MSRRASDVWLCQEYEGEVHVVPTFDSQDHLLSRDCECDPRLDESDPRVVVHTLASHPFTRIGAEPTVEETCL